MFICDLLFDDFKQIFSSNKNLDKLSSLIGLIKNTYPANSKPHIRIGSIFLEINDDGCVEINFSARFPLIDKKYLTKSVLNKINEQKSVMDLLNYLANVITMNHACE